MRRLEGLLYNQCTIHVSVPDIGSYIILGVSIYKHGMVLLIITHYRFYDLVCMQKKIRAIISRSMGTSVRKIFFGDINICWSHCLLINIEH